MFDEYGNYIGSVNVTGFSEFCGSFNDFVSAAAEQHEELKEMITSVSEQNDIMINQFAELSRTQGNTMVLNMLLCGLLGIIIGICFVNIFKGGK